VLGACQGPAQQRASAPQASVKCGHAVYRSRSPGVRGAPFAYTLVCVSVFRRSLRLRGAPYEPSGIADLSEACIVPQRHAVRPVCHVARPAGNRTGACKNDAGRFTWAAPVRSTERVIATPPAAARDGGAGRLVRAAPLLMSAAAAARPLLPPCSTPAGRRCHPPLCPPPVRCAVRWGIAHLGDSARTPLGHATHPGVWGFVRQGPTPRVSNAAGVGGHARARRNDAMRVDAPPSVASSEHSRRAADTGAGACGTVALGGIGATPGGDADDLSSTDEEEAPGTLTAL